MRDPQNMSWTQLWNWNHYNTLFYLRQQLVLLKMYHARFLRLTLLNIDVLKKHLMAYVHTGHTGKRFIWLCSWCCAETDVWSWGIPEYINEALTKEIYRYSFASVLTEALVFGLVVPSTTSMAELLRRYGRPLLLINRAKKIKVEYPATTIQSRKLGNCLHSKDSADLSITISHWMD